MTNDKLNFDDMLFDVTFDEMICYDPYATILGKARKIYVLCVKQGHFDLAKKIWNKHSKYKSQNSDLVTSFGMLLNAQKK